MSVSIKGLDKLQRTLGQAEKAFQALDGTLANLSFDPHDASAVEGAIAETKLAIDKKLAPYRGNEFVEKVAKELKVKYRDEILKKAATARLDGKANTMNENNNYQDIFQKIENTVTDLQRAQYNTFDRHIKKLSNLLNEESLCDTNQKLTEGLDLEAWVSECKKSQESMAGSANLSWPSDEKKELGTVILLIHYFANTPNKATNFSHDFYYNGSNITSNLQNMVAEMIVPFARDYIGYLKKQTGTPSPSPEKKPANVDHSRIWFEELLHPEIQKHALRQFTNGDLREAVLNSVMAVFDLIRKITGLDEDGDKLIGKAFSLEDPYLILDEIKTESGKNDQKGFIQIFKGAYQGIRNPKAHSLSHNLTKEKAAQYLVFSSLLARRVKEATLVKELNKKTMHNKHE